MKLSIKNIIIIIAFLLPNVSCSTDADDDIVIQDWEILFNEDASPAEIAKENGWKPVMFPSMFKKNSDLKRKFNYLWLKAVFFINGDPASYFGVTTGKIYYCNEIFINGALVGKRVLGGLWERHRRYI